jgi:transposase InsO family protein
MNPRGPKLVKRGWPAQRGRREADRAARRQVVAFDRWARRHGSSRQDVARHLGVSPRTLSHWEQRWREDHLVARPCGRSVHRSDVQARNMAIHLMTVLGPRTGLATLAAACPTLSRSELKDLQRRFRRLWCRNHRRLLRVLHWHRPGAVWAMDHTDPPQPVDGRWRHILTVRDLASRMQLGWIPVASEDADETCRALEGLFCRHGPPLVLKSDNGSAFIAELTRKLLARRDVWPLYSPPRTPQYNGSCEATGGAMKTRTEHQAALRNRPGQWIATDLRLAQAIANHYNRPGGPRGPTPAEVWRKRQPITSAERAAFARLARHHQDRARHELDYTQEQPLDRNRQARIDRLAIRRACVERGFLTFTRRSFTPPITPRFAARIPDAAQRMPERTARPALMER